MPTVFRGPDGDDHLVAHARQDLVVAAGAAVHLHRVVGLDVAHLHLVHLVHLVEPRAHPNTAHATSAAITTKATPTRTMSLPRLVCPRNGLNPTPSR